MYNDNNQNVSRQDTVPPLSDEGNSRKIELGAALLLASIVGGILIGIGALDEFFYKNNNGPLFNNLFRDMFIRMAPFVLGVVGFIMMIAGGVKQVRAKQKLSRIVVFSLEIVAILITVSIIVNLFLD